MRATVQKVTDSVGRPPFNEARWLGLGSRWKQLRSGMGFKQRTMKHWVDLEGVGKVEMVGDCIDLVDDGEWTNESGRELSEVSVKLEVDSQTKSPIW